MTLKLGDLAGMSDSGRGSFAFHIDASFGLLLPSLGNLARPFGLVEVSFVHSTRLDGREPSIRKKPPSEPLE